MNRIFNIPSCVPGPRDESAQTNTNSLPCGVRYLPASGFHRLSGSITPLTNRWRTPRPVPPTANQRQGALPSSRARCVRFACAFSPPPGTTSDGVREGLLFGDFQSNIRQQCAYYAVRRRPGTRVRVKCSNISAGCKIIILCSTHHPSCTLYFGGLTPRFSYIYLQYSRRSAG